MEREFVLRRPRLSPFLLVAAGMFTKYRCGSDYSPQRKPASNATTTSPLFAQTVPPTTATTSDEASSSRAVTAPRSARRTRGATGLRAVRCSAATSSDAASVDGPSVLDDGLPTPPPSSGARKRKTTRVRSSGSQKIAAVGLAATPGRAATVEESSALPTPPPSARKRKRDARSTEPTPKRRKGDPAALPTPQASSCSSTPTPEPRAKKAKHPCPVVVVPADHPAPRPSQYTLPSPDDDAQPRVDAVRVRTRDLRESESLNVRWLLYVRLVLSEPALVQRTSNPVPHGVRTDILQDVYATTRGAYSLRR